MEITRTARIKTKYNDFSGGIQAYTSPLWLQANESPCCKNIDIHRPGEIRKAMGYEELGTSTGTTAPRGLFVFNVDEGDSIVYKLTNDALKKFTTGWTQVTGSIATGTHALEAALMYINTGTGVGTGADTFSERMYFCLGLNDKVKYTTGVAIGEVADVYAKHMEVYRDRLYLGGVRVKNETQPFRVMFSEINDDDFRSTDYFDSMNEPISALCEYAGNLMIFSENKLATWDEYSLKEVPGTFGTTSSYSVQKVQGRLIWYNRGGVFMYTGSELPTNIGKRVQPWLDAIVDAREVTAGIDEEDRYNLYIGDVTVDDVTYEDVVLRYNVALNQWDMLPDRPFKYWVKQRGGGVNIPYATDVDNDKVWKVNSSRALNGEVILSEWQSAKLDLAKPDSYKNFYKAWVTFKPQGVNEFFTLQYRLDGATGWNNIGNTTSNVSVSGSDDIEVKRLDFPPNVQGKMIQFKLSHSSSGNGFNLYDITVDGDELASR